MFRNPYADGLIVLLIVLLIFGPKRLPSLGRSLGQGMREFKDSITGGDSEDEAEERPAIAPTTGTGAPADPAAPIAGEGSEAAPTGTRSDRESAEVGSPERRS